MAGRGGKEIKQKDAMELMSSVSKFFSKGEPEKACSGNHEKRNRTGLMSLLIWGGISLVPAAGMVMLDHAASWGMLIPLWLAAWGLHWLLLMLIPRFFPMGSAILWAMAAGLVVGWFCRNSVYGLFIADWLNLYGVIFLRLLVMVVPVLILVSITRGVASLGDPAALGRLGLKTIAFYLFTTLLATAIGLLCVNILHPGHTLVSADKPSAGESDTFATDTSSTSQQTSAGRGTGGRYGQRLQKEILPGLIKTPFMDGVNPLTIILFALLLGAALGALGSGGVPLLAAVQALDDALVRMILWFMKLAPMAVFTLMAKATGEFGTSYLQTLSLYMLTVLLGLTVHFLILTCVLVPLLGGVSPRRFFKAMMPALTLAFGISSSSATLPLTIHCTHRRLGVDRGVCEFMLPLGATVNMDGTALYQAVAVMFLAFANGLHPTFGQQAAVFAGAVLVSIGTAGIPGGSIALMPITLGLLGIGPETIGLIIGLDRLLDMSRTVVNITGDAVGCIVVARSEGKLGDIQENADP